MLDRINLQINLEWTRAQDYEWIILAGKFNNYDREGFRVALQKRKGKGVGEHLLLGISFLGFHVYQRLKGAYISGKEHAFKASNYWGRCVMGTINYCGTRIGGKNETVLRTVNWDLDGYQGNKIDAESEPFLGPRFIFDRWSCLSSHLLPHHHLADEI
jgi:hypothetical protein